MDHWCAGRSKQWRTELLNPPVPPTKQLRAGDQRSTAAQAVIILQVLETVFRIARCLEVQCLGGVGGDSPGVIGQRVSQVLDDCVEPKLREAVGEMVRAMGVVQ